MPELPELEVISEFLNKEIIGKKIEDINIIKSICIRTGKNEFITDLKNQKFKKIERMGKTLIFTLDTSVLLINLMLTGRLQYLKKKVKLEKKIHFYIEFDDGSQLRYFDRKKMGKVYHFNGKLPQKYHKDAPDIMKISENEFVTSIKKYARSSIKDVLTNQKFVQGIGNAYSDEILYEAKILPLRKVKELTEQELLSIYKNSAFVLNEAIEIIKSNFNGVIEEQNRVFMKVHGKKEENCPACGNPISTITANRRILNYCRKCQK